MDEQWEVSEQREPVSLRARMEFALCISLFALIVLTTLALRWVFHRGCQSADKVVRVLLCLRNKSLK